MNYNSEGQRTAGAQPVRAKRVSKNILQVQKGEIAMSGSGKKDKGNKEQKKKSKLNPKEKRKLKIEKKKNKFMPG